MKLRPECWIYNDLCNGLERNQNGLERTIYVPILTMLPVILIKGGVMILDVIKIFFFSMQNAVSGQKWLFCAGGMI